MSQTLDSEPLIEEHRLRLRAALREAAELLPRMDRAERCGSDCQHFRRLRDEIVRQLEAYDREFFPIERDAQ